MTAVAGSAAAVAYLALPRFGAAHRALWLALLLVSAAAVLVGGISARPRPLSGRWADRLRVAAGPPWALIAAALAVAAADALGSGIGAGGGPVALAARILPIVGFVALARARLRGAELAGLLDSLIIGTALVLVCAVVLGGEGRAGDPGALALPLADVVQLTLLVWFWLERGERPPALNLLLVGAAGLLAADLAWAAAGLDGGYQPGGVVDLGWVVWGLGCAAAALHPSAAAMRKPPERPPARLTVPGIALLAALPVLVALALLGWWWLGEGWPPEVAVTGWPLLLLLVVVRLVALTRQVAGQAERRHLVAQVIRATEDERTRIARDLHDGPVQQLAVLGYAVHGIRRRLERGDSVGATRLLNGLEEGLSKEVHDLRRLMTELRPAVLDERGLEAALRDQVAALGREARLQATYEGALPERLAPELETVLYRVAQEALHNVGKHAQATTVRVRLAQDGKRGVALTVADDGIGFDLTRRPSELLRNGHYGLAGMRERAALTGGRLTIRSIPGRGTTVRVSVPRDE